MKRAIILCAAFAATVSTSTWAQSGDPAGTISHTTRTAVQVGVAPTIQELEKLAPSPNSFGAEIEVPNRTIPNFLLDRPIVETESDSLAAPLLTRRAPGALLSFEGYNNIDNNNLVGGLVAPPDVNGDVGRDFYVQYINLGWMVFNKSDGSVAAGPFVGNLFWQAPGFTGPCRTDNAGDPIVLYDQFADRWIFSQFTSPNNPDGRQCFAISQGSNPLGPYFLYEFLVSPGEFNDYPKIGLWTDGAGQSAYHMMTNQFGPGGFSGVQLTAFERDVMLAGGNAQQDIFRLSPAATPTAFAVQPPHLEGPAAPGGSCAPYVQAIDKQTFGGAGADGYQFWRFCTNWNNPNASTFTATSFISTAAFDAELCGFSRDCIEQPATTQNLDALGQFTMYRFANRFVDGNHMGVINHTIDTGGNIAGIRWAQFDINSANGTASLADTGTLAPGDGDSRWVGSAALDSAGNMGLSYTRSSNATFPGVFFTGRETGDPAGTLQSESACVIGTGSQLGINRWVDYSSISVDPVDGCTFWMTNEYVETTGTRNWTTRICSFRFPSCDSGGGSDVNFASGTAVGDQPDASSFRTVSYGETLTNPIVVMGPPSFNGTQPTSIRVRNVGATSFEYQIEEWDYLDGGHITENVGFLAVEAGRGTIGGLAIEAGATSTNQNFVNVTFSSPFPSAPVVVAQAVTRNGGQAITRRVRNVTTTGFQVRVQEEEGNDGTHNAETIHWIAIEPGNSNAGGVPVAVGRTANTVTQNFFTINFGGSTVVNPVFIADMQTFDGSDPAALRHQSLTSTSVQVKVEEEQSGDTEVAHTTEVIGWIAIGDD